MKRQLSAVSLAVFVSCMAMTPGVRAQTGERKFEAGGHIATLHLSDSDNKANAGYGGRVSYDLLRWLAVEGEINLFENETFEQRFSASTLPGLTLGYHRRRVDGFFGPKVGVRAGRFGVFGKIRPGFARLVNKGLECVGDGCALILPAPIEYRPEFAIDVGGVLEFYPTSRTVTRLDLGSTMIRHRSLAPPCRDCTSRNLASRIGLGIRF